VSNTRTTDARAEPAHPGQRLCHMVEKRGTTYKCHRSMLYQENERVMDVPAKHYIYVG
jgi:hypothetical protein